MAGFKDNKKPLFVYGLFSLISLVVLPALNREDILYFYTWEHFHKPGFQRFIPTYSFEHISFESQENHEGIGELGLARTLKRIKTACKVIDAKTFVPSHDCDTLLQRQPQLQEARFVIKTRTYSDGAFHDSSFRIVMDRKNGVAVENL